MFETSLELQKYVFTNEILKNVDKQQQIITILKKEPYKKYVIDVMKGVTGEEYTQKTITFLKE